MPSLLQSLNIGDGYQVVDAGLFKVRVRSLTFADVAELEVALGMLRAVVDTDGKKKKPSPQSPENARKTAALMQEITCACVTQASKDGEKWEPMEIVADLAKQHAGRNRLWVGRLSKTVISEVVKAAQAGYVEAQEAFATFPGGS